MLLLGVLLCGLIKTWAGPAVLERVQLHLKWRHQFQFAGYYAALHKGFYREAGLEVEIREAGGVFSPVDSVLKGQSEFGIYGTDLVRYRAAGVPVVAVAAIFQHSPAVIVGRRDRGISQIEDLAGKQVYMEPDAADLLAFLKLKGMETNRYTNPFDPQKHDFSVESLIQGRVDAMYVYLTDEIFTLSNARVPSVVFSPRDAGIDFYADILFTTEQTLAEKPRMVRAFRDATVRGWEYAMAHQGEIIQLILDQYTTRHSREHLQFEATQMEPLLDAGIIEAGYMSKPRWQTIVDTYRRVGLLRGEVDLDRFVYEPAARQTLVIRYWKGALLAALIAGGALLLSWRFFRLSRNLQIEIHQRQATEAALRKEVDERKRAGESITALASLGLQLSAVHAAKEAAEIIMAVADRLFGWDACKLDLYAPNQNRIYQLLIKDTVHGKRVEFPPPYDHPHPSPLTRQIIDQGARLILRGPEEVLPGAVAFGSKRPSASLMFVPVRQGAAVRGVATIQSYSPNAYTQEDLTAFQALVDHCGGALERLRIQEDREQLIQQLQAALAQVKTLSGLLPICAQCKKIRDDRGYWNQVEVYIRDRSAASFTHSICPECSRKLYPQLYDDEP